MNTGRRAWMRCVVAGALAATAARPAAAAAALALPESFADPEAAREFWDAPRVLHLRRRETREEATVCYWRDGALDRDGYAATCHLMRDVRAQSTVAMDVRLLDMLRGATAWLEAAHGITAPYEITSGYRTARTNRATEGAARDSLHLHGKALDGRIAGLTPRDLGRLLWIYQAGGVGLYPRRDFLHMDVGRVRAWVR